MKLLRHILIISFLSLLAVSGRGQTNPPAQSLPYSQSFGTTTFTTMPTGTASWSGLNGGSVTTQALAEVSVPNNNANVTAATTPQGNGNTYGFATSSDGRVYVQTSNSGTDGVNQVACAIVTTNLNNISVSYVVEIINAQIKTVGIVMQYRVGTSGTWTTVAGTGNPYSQSGGTTGIKASPTIILPVAANNQPVVQIRWATWRGNDGNANSSGIAVDNISIIGSAIATPNITHTGTSPAAANIAQQSVNNVLHSLQVDATVATANLTQLVATTGGTWMSGDLANCKLWISTDNTFGGDVLISTLNSPAPGTLTFSGLNSNIPLNGTRYFFITCDVATAAVVGRTVSARTTVNGNMTYSPVPTFSGGAFAAANEMTITGVPEIQLEYPIATPTACGATTVAFGNVTVGQTSDLVFRIRNSGGADLNLTTFPLVIGGANADQYSIQTQPANPIVPGAFSDVTVRFAPSSGGAKVGSITIANNDITGSEDPCVVSLTGTGVALPNVMHTGTTPAASNINQGSTNSILYTTKIDVTNQAVNLTQVVASTGGTWVAADLTNFKLWLSTDAVFGGDILLKTLPSPATGDQTFSSFTGSGSIPVGSRWLFITCDITSGATIGNTISAFTDMDADFTYTENETNSGSTFQAANLLTIIGLAEIQLEYPVGTPTACGATTLAYGSVVLNQNSDLTFRIRNLGTADLSVTLPLVISGTNANQFSIVTPPTSPIAPGSFSDAVIRFTPTTTGAKTATISIGNSDSNENPCAVSLTGTGVLANDNCSGAVSLSVSADLVCTTSVTGTTVGATNSGAGNLLCNLTTGTADDDVWYSFTATATAQRITVVGTSPLDAVVDLRSGACNGTNIACADATNAGGTEVLDATGLTIGATYFVRIYGWGSATGFGPFTICVTTPVFYYYRTIASGSWTGANTWERSVDEITWNPTAVTPTLADLSVNVRSPHAVTISASTTLDQTTIEVGSTLEVISATLTINNGTGTDLTVNGILKNTLGIITTTGTISVENGGRYQHNWTTSSGAVPTATWQTGSTCEILAANTGLTGLIQDFYHFVWNNSVNTALNVLGTLRTIKGDFTMVSTGASGDLRLAATAAAFPGLVIDGNLTLQNGADLILTSGDQVGALTLKGNLDLCVSCTISETGTGNGSILLNGASQQTVNGNDAVMTGTIPVTVNNAAGVALLSDFNISNNLILTTGQIRTNGFVMELSTNSTTITSNATNFVCTCSADGGTASTTGGLRRRVLASTTLLFPVGPLSGTYMPASIIAQGGHATDFFTARVEPLQSNGVSVPDPTKCIQYQWELNESTAGGSNARVKLQWLAGTEGSSFSPTTLPVIGRWSGSNFNPISVATYSAGDPSFESVSNFTGFSPFIAASQGALPVELIGFNAAKRNKEVALDWSTASEQDNDFFAIERSINGNDYHEIGQVEGKGTTLLTSRYSFMDKTPTSGDNYYRLRQVDFNAEFAYSPVRVVRMEQGTSYQVFPTLVSNTLTVRASDISEEDLQLSIISTANGQLISTQTMTAGNTQSEINTESLPQGSYMLQLTKRNEVQHFMFIKQ